MNRNQVNNILLMFLVYLFCSSFPWHIIFKGNAYLIITMQILLSFLCMGYLLYSIRTNGLVFPQRRIRVNNILLFAPLLVVCFSNYLYLPFYSYNSINGFSWYTVLVIVLTIIVCINEELLFRYILLHTLTFDKPIIRILISSLIFALFHIARFFSSFNPYDLLVVLYAFGLGMILGLLYQYGKSLVACIIFHFVFNLFNDILFSSLFVIHNQTGMIIVSLVIALIAAIYLSILYFLKFKKEDF